MNLYYPYQFDGRKGTAQATDDEYVRQLIEQVLFTTPGERVNLPDFGSGLLQLVFAPNSAEMAAATQFSVQSALQKWLGAYVRVVSVEAVIEDGATLKVSVAYSRINSDVTQVQTFIREVAG
jgi:phage baseplate assembly protein W